MSPGLTAWRPIAHRWPHSQDPSRCPETSSFAMLEIRGLSPSLCLLSLLLVLHGAERSQPPPRRRFEYKLSFKGPRLAVPGAGIPFWSHHGGEEQRRTRHVQGPPECWRACSQRDSGCEGLYSRGNTEVTVPGPGPSFPDLSPAPPGPAALSICEGPRGTGRTSCWVCRTAQGHS